ncbi:MAG: hypothetical protein QM754_11065 [Tepidisphaeraceae bacterium]
MGIATDDHEQSPAVSYVAVTPAATWIFGLIIPAILAALGVAAIVHRFAYASSSRFWGTTRPITATGQQAVGWGIALLGIAVLLNAIFFVDANGAGAMKSPIRFIIAAAAIPAGVLVILFSEN